MPSPLASMSTVWLRSMTSVLASAPRRSRWSRATPAKSLARRGDQSIRGHQHGAVAVRNRLHDKTLPSRATSTAADEEDSKRGAIRLTTFGNRTISTFRARDSWLCDPASRRVCSYRVLRCPSVVTSLRSDLHARLNINRHDVALVALNLWMPNRRSCCATAVCRTIRTSRRCRIFSQPSRPNDRSR